MMNIQNIFKRHSLLFIVCGISLLQALWLGFACWDINFWPTDAKAYYFDAAVKLPQFQHLSQIHSLIDQDQVRWLHGKEIYILFVSLFQRLIHDTLTLRPFILLGIAAVFFSSVLVFVLARRYWGRKPALVSYFLFVTSFWPYLYILFAKHQTLGLFWFLWSIFFLPQQTHRKINLWLYLFSGLLLGLSLFSSTVSVLYLPFYLTAFLHSCCMEKVLSSKIKAIGQVLLRSAICVGGVLSVVVYVNYPNVLGNIESFLEYVQISGSYNHFFYNQPYLKQWFLQTDVASARGGLVWVFKYFMVIMPVLFPFSILCGVYVLFRGCRKKGRALIEAVVAWVLVLAPILMAEISKVAQYGANYFPCFLGFIALVGFAVYLFQKEKIFLKKGLVFSRGIILFFVLLAIAQASVNCYIFLSDVYPTRMVTTFVSRELKKHHVKELYTYLINPHRDYFTRYLNPEVQSELRLIAMKSINEVHQGMVLVPPVSGDSIYIASMSYYTDFEDDVYLNALVESGKIRDYAVASFKTMINSRIWVHEEEILSYRKLILGHQIPEKQIKGYVWVLDAGKMAEERAANMPNQRMAYLHESNFRYIGTNHKLYAYHGYSGTSSSVGDIRNVVVKLYKEGDPKDALIMYAYRLGTNRHVWVPFQEHWTSDPVDASQVSSAPQGAFAVFRFNPPLSLTDENFLFMIFRTGQKDDQNYYLIDKTFAGFYPKG